MYIEILAECVTDYRSKEKDNSHNNIVINLTPRIYKALQSELNSICKFTTEVPIEEVTFTSIKIHGRTIRIESNEKLDQYYEERIVDKLNDIVMIDTDNKPNIMLVGAVNEAKNNENG